MRYRPRRARLVRRKTIRLVRSRRAFGDDVRYFYRRPVGGGRLSRPTARGRRERVVLRAAARCRRVRPGDGRFGSRPGWGGVPPRGGRRVSGWPSRRVVPCCSAARAVRVAFGVRQPRAARRDSTEPAPRARRGHVLPPGFGRGQPVPHRLPARLGRWPRSRSHVLRGHRSRRGDRAFDFPCPRPDPVDLATPRIAHFHARPAWPRDCCSCHDPHGLLEPRGQMAMVAGQGVTPIACIATSRADRGLDRHQHAHRGDVGRSPADRGSARPLRAPTRLIAGWRGEHRRRVFAATGSSSRGGCSNRIGGRRPSRSDRGDQRTPDPSETRCRAGLTTPREPQLGRRRALGGLVVRGAGFRIRGFGVANAGVVVVLGVARLREPSPCPRRPDDWSSAPPGIQEAPVR